MKLRMFEPLALTVLGRTALQCLMLAVVSSALSAWSTAPETTATYTYAGSLFCLEQCDVIVGDQAYIFTNGQVTATVTFQNLRPGYTGLDYERRPRTPGITSVALRRPIRPIG